MTTKTKKIDDVIHEIWQEVNAKWIKKSEVKEAIDKILSRRKNWEFTRLDFF